MARQMFLFDIPGVVKNNIASSEIRILNWNIANPSIERAYKQFDWLIKTKANIIILTEAKYSKGCTYIKDGLENVGFNVLFPEPENNDYNVMLAAKGFHSEKWELNLPFLPHRLVSFIIKTFLGNLKLIGMYVPSRGPKEKRNVNKRKFQDQIIKFLGSSFRNKNKSNLIVGGDLNVIEPDHVPHYPVFGDWEYEFYNFFIKIGLVDAYKFCHKNTQEYSWFGKYRDGYRFDHLFVAKNISSFIKECYYIHEPRISKLSDHSAIFLKLLK